MYGVVEDVFIKYSRGHITTYAFVRFKTLNECLIAIGFGNGG